MKMLQRNYLNMEILTDSQILGIKEKYPGIPKDYLDWLSRRGWGEAENGYMIYSHPAYADELVESECPEVIKPLLMVGDDMAGYWIGYIKNESQWQFVGVDSCDWEVEPAPEGFSSYLSG